MKDFYPRPPRGERREVFILPKMRVSYFYPRPPRGERRRYRRRPTPAVNFYPRPPRGERLLAGFVDLSGYVISIHALREESDPERAPPEAGRGAISIHALREESDM